MSVNISIFILNMIRVETLCPKMARVWTEICMTLDIFGGPPVVTEALAERLDERERQLNIILVAICFILPQMLHLLGCFLNLP